MNLKQMSAMVFRIKRRYPKKEDLELNVVLGLMHKALLWLRKIHGDSKDIQELRLNEYSTRNENQGAAKYNPEGTGHEQVRFSVDGDFEICVDRGMEDIIRVLFHWGCHTINSCIDNNGSVWIEFESFGDSRRFMKLALRNCNQINGGPDGFQRETLWDFIEEYGHFELLFDEEVIDDPDEENTVIRTGQLQEGVSLRFDKDLLEDFRRLICEVLPYRPKEALPSAESVRNDERIGHHQQ